MFLLWFCMGPVSFEAETAKLLAKRGHLLFECDLIGTQPRPFLSMLSVAGFSLQQQS